MEQVFTCSIFVTIIDENFKFIIIKTKMAKISVFNFISLNGCYKGPKEDISWHKQGDKSEEGEYAKRSLKADSILLFGRTTYDMMSSFWPTPEAAKAFPEVAKGMNAAEKIVFSRKLKKADWNNTTLIKGNLIDEVKKLKKSAKKDITILGSGTIITQLSENGLIDSYQFMIDPVVVSNGTSIFDKIKKGLDLKLIETKVFKSGAVLHSYKPKK